MYFSTDTGIFCFTAAGLEVEVNDQQIQTEIIETEHKHVQAGSTATQQGFTQLCAEYTLKIGIQEV